MNLSATTAIASPWKADPVHSSIGFEIEHLGVSAFRGRFRDFRASIEVSDSGLSISGVAPVASIDVDDPQLRGHLLSPDFFDAERAPEISFEAAQLSSDGEDLVVAGELTMRGETRPVTARGRIGEPGIDPNGNERVGLRLEATVDRREFGVGQSMELPNGKPVIANEVALLAELELVKEG